MVDLRGSALNTQRMDDVALNRTIERTWPRPLALAWGRMRASADPYEQRMRQVAFAEILFRVLLTYGVADYLTGSRSNRKGKRRTNPEHLLKELSKRPGDSLLKDSGVQLVLSAAEREDGTFFPDMAQWLDEVGSEDKTRNEQLGWLVSMRNEAAHGPRSPSAAVEAQRAAEYYELLREVVESMGWIQRYRVVHVDEATAAGDGVFAGRLDDLTGDSSVPAVIPGRWRGWLNTGSVYVMNPDGSAALLVSPLWNVDRHETSGELRVWIFRQVGSRTGEIKLVDDFRADERWHSPIDGDGTELHWKDWVERRDEHRRKVAVVDLDGTLAAPKGRVTFVSSSEAGARPKATTNASAAASQGAAGSERQATWAPAARVALISAVLMLAAAGFVALRDRQESPDGTVTPIVDDAPTETSGSPETEARAAYLGLLTAWNEMDEDAYFAGFPDVVSCWYDSANRPLQRIRDRSRGAHFRDQLASRLVSDRLELVRASDDEVAFIDHGRLVGTSGSSTEHQKFIVMRATATGWKLVVEVSPERHACWPDVPESFRRD